MCQLGEERRGAHLSMEDSPAPKLMSALVSRSSAPEVLSPSSCNRCPSFFELPSADQAHSQICLLCLTPSYLASATAMQRMSSTCILAIGASKAFHLCKWSPLRGRRILCCSDLGQDLKPENKHMLQLMPLYKSESMNPVAQALQEGKKCNAERQVPWVWVTQYLGGFVRRTVDASPL